RPGGGRPGRLRGADGRQGQGGRRLDEEQGPGRRRPGHAGRGEGRDAQEAVRAGLRHEVTPQARRTAAVAAVPAAPSATSTGTGPQPVRCGNARAPSPAGPTTIATTP